jgi:hypothetical protein
MGEPEFFSQYNSAIAKGQFGFDKTNQTKTNNNTPANFGSDKLLELFFKQWETKVSLKKSNNDTFLPYQ